MLTHAQIEPRPSASSELFSRGRVHAWPRPFRANQRGRRHCVDAGDARYPRPLRSRRLERRRAPPRHCSPVCSGGLTGAMYEGGSDPYCYPGSSVLKNRLDLRDQAELDAFESLITAQRAEEPLPGGRLGYAHYRAISITICFKTCSTRRESPASCASPRAVACSATPSTSTARCGSYSRV